MDHTFTNPTYYTQNHRAPGPAFTYPANQHYPQAVSSNGYNFGPLPPQRANLSHANSLFDQSGGSHRSYAPSYNLAPSQPSHTYAPYSMSNSSYTTHVPQGLPSSLNYASQMHANPSTSSMRQPPKPLMSDTSRIQITPLPAIAAPSQSHYAPISAKRQALSTPPTPLAAPEVLSNAHSPEATSDQEDEATSSTKKAAVIPMKDADGKYPCQHCNKTYLHAKHLKRHLLRHTGDRPYMCILCGDKFSRSDILKRHFQKCELRRGNPTGATHLSHASAHVKKNASKRSSGADLLADSASLPPAQSTLSSNDGPREMSKSTIHASDQRLESQESMSTPGSRRNSLKRSSLHLGPVKDRRSLTGAYPAAFGRSNLATPGDNFSPTSYSNSTASTPLESHGNRLSGHFGTGLTSNGEVESDITLAPFHAHDSHDADVYSHKGSNGSSDWAPYGTILPSFSENYGGGVGNDLSTYKISQNDHHPFTSLPGQHDADFHGLFDGNGSEHTPVWSMDDSQPHTWEAKSKHLTNLCFGSSVPTSEEDVSSRACLAPENIQHFLELYSNFQSHWPVLHLATFSPSEAYDGLLLVLMCIGAVYSDRVDIRQVRSLMGRVYDVLNSTSDILQPQDDPALFPDIASMSYIEYEQLLAYSLYYCLSIWHGDAEQRQKARDEFGRLVEFSHKANMLSAVGIEHPSFSPLHQRSSVYEQIMMNQTADDWDWPRWVLQEKKLRLLYILFLTDSALVVFFNCRPLYDPRTIHLPLPADDAAWDARDAMECAVALGLHGEAAQSGRNTSGSLRHTQLEMDTAFRCLMQPNVDIPFRSTNAYSKFILIHALHTQIWKVQVQISQGNQFYDANEQAYYHPVHHTGAAANQYNNDRYLHHDRSGHTSASASSPGTPTTSSGAQTPGLHQVHAQIFNALEKWRRSWNDDMAVQYPPTSNSTTNPNPSPTSPSTNSSGALSSNNNNNHNPTHPPSSSSRSGFCRDGIHFYWLGRLFLSQSNPHDWLTPPDQRFLHVMSILKSVRAWISSESAARGEEIGSVGDLHESYGVEDLTIDMKLLFVPLLAPSPLSLPLQPPPPPPTGGDGLLSSSSLSQAQVQVHRNGVGVGSGPGTGTATPASGLHY
ncbi:hypothetical protein MMC25_006613 [Agyrium rufum]|nr:hypothetical protein [Agyrium rufum]